MVLNRKSEKIAINKEPKTFAKLRHAASIAETSISVSVNTIQSLQDKMAAEMQTLRQQIHSMQTSMQNSRQPPEAQNSISEMPFDEVDREQTNILNIHKQTVCLTVAQIFVQSAKNYFKEYERRHKI